MSQREDDLRMLAELLEERITPAERDSFADMVEWLRDADRRKLSEKQRAWVTKVLDRHRPTYANEWSAGRVPRGNDVAINCGPKVLRPPGRVGA